MKTIYKRFKVVNIFLIFLLLIEIIPFASVSSEEVIKIENVRFELHRGLVYIYYDLTGHMEKEFEVTLFLMKEGDKLFVVEPKSVTGDIGKGFFAGTKRRVIWDVTKEFPQGLVGKDYYFIVEAEFASGGISPWVWIGGGAVVLGGAAALLLKKGTSSTSTPTGFPDFPGRPQ